MKTTKENVLICFTLTGSPSKATASTTRDSAKDTEKSKSNLPPDTSLWTVTEVVSFFSSLGFPEEAKSFQNQVRKVKGETSALNTNWPTPP